MTCDLDNIKCPYCGNNSEATLPLTDNEVLSLQCENCGKWFDVEQQIQVIYCTMKHSDQGIVYPASRDLEDDKCGYYESLRKLPACTNPDCPPNKYQDMCPAHGFVKDCPLKAK